MHTHHTIEDVALFPAIRHSKPELGSVVDRLEADHRKVLHLLDEIEAGVAYVNRKSGATTGAWPGVQSFGGWKMSGSTGKSALGPYYVQQFMREQTQTVVVD